MRMKRIKTEIDALIIHNGFWTTVRAEMEKKPIFTRLLNRKTMRIYKRDNIGRIIGYEKAI